MWTAIKSLVTNPYWLLCIFMCLGFFFLMSYASSVTVYFAQYILNNVDMQGTITTVMYVVILVGIVAALPVMMKFGKRIVMIIGLAIACIGWMMPAFSLNETFVTAAAAVIGFGFGTIAAPAGSFLQDTLTYGEWKSGISAIGMGNAVFSFTTKLSSSLGIVVQGVVLDHSGFDAKLAAQPEVALTAIRFLYIYLPAMICAAVLVMAFFYDLDRKLPKINEELKAGKKGETRTKNLFS